MKITLEAREREHLKIYFGRNLQYQNSAIPFLHGLLNKNYSQEEKAREGERWGSRRRGIGLREDVDIVQIIICKHKQETIQSEDNQEIIIRENNEVNALTLLLRFTFYF